MCYIKKFLYAFGVHNLVLSLLYHNSINNTLAMMILQNLQSKCITVHGFLHVKMLKSAVNLTDT